MKSFLKGKKDKPGDSETSKAAEAKSTSGSQADSTVTTPPQGPEFAIQRIYLKSLAYETPTTPGVFAEEWKPTIDMQIQTTTSKLQEGLHEAIVKVTVTSKSGDTIILKVEVEQAGIFIINHFSTEQLGAVLGGMCPNILFPYAREVITDLSARGTFPLIYLAPINFDAVYAQAIQKQNAEAGKSKA